MITTGTDHVQDRHLTTIENAGTTGLRLEAIVTEETGEVR